MPKITGNRRKRGYPHRRDEKRAYLEANRSRYRQAEYPGTSKILDEFCVVSGYPRKYAIRLRAHQPRSPVGDLCRQLGVNEGPFYTWKKKERTWGSERPLPPPAAGGREWAVESTGD